MHPLDTASFSVRLAVGVAAAVISWAAATDIGHALLRRLVPESASFASVLFGAVLGYALLGSAVAALAMLHLLNTWSALAIPLLGITVRFGRHASRVRELSSVVRSLLGSWRSLSVMEKILCISALAAAGVSLVAAALPAVWWDPLAYHLPIVALALQHGGLSFDSGLPQTGFPLLAEAAALPAYALAGSAGAAMVTLGAGIVLAITCGFIADSLRRGSGLLATTLVLTSALWLWLAPSFYVDIPFAMFAVGAVALPYLWRGADNASLGILCGVLAGAAAATKYPGLVIGILALTSLVYVRRLSAVPTFALGFLTIALAWYLRSWTLTGDPLYPFLTALLSHHRPSAEAVRYCGTPVSWFNAVLLPWRLLAEPGRFCGDPGFALRLASVPFISAAIFLKKTRPLVGLIVALTAFWFVSAQQWRFLLSALTLFAAVAAAMVYAVETRIRILMLTILGVLSLVAVAAELMPSLIAVASNSLAPAYGYITGKQTATKYLSRRLESYAAAQWLASHNPAAKIYAADDVRDYYFGTNVAWGNSPYPGGWRLDWTLTPQQRYISLRQRGYCYMVVNANPAYTHRTDANIDWQMLARDEAAGVVRRAFSENDVYVYDVCAGR